MNFRSGKNLTMLTGMDLQLPSFSLALAFLLLIILTKRARAKQPPRLPPGPWKLPIIGSLHHLPGDLPHRRLHELARKHGPLMHLKLGQISTVVASTPEIAKEIMKTHDLVFATRPEILAAKIFAYGCTDVVCAPYGDYWRAMKRICVQELLTTKRVKSFQSIREEEASSLVRSINLSVGSQVDLSEKFFNLSNNVISRAAFGGKCKQQKRFLVAMKETNELASGFTLADLYPSLEFINIVTGAKYRSTKTHQKLDHILNEIIEEHKLNRQAASGNLEVEEEGMLDILLRLQQEGNLDVPLTIDNIKAVVLDLFAAGTETSATTMEWAMSELMANPEVMGKAQAEVRRVFEEKGKVDEDATGDMSYLKLVIKETFRLHPPVPLLVPRESRESCSVRGYDIPAKTRAFVNAWAVGRDPEYWSNPEQFQPERFRGSPVDFKGAHFEYVPFGAGRRMCPGSSFGWATVELAIAELLYYFNWENPNGDKPEDLDMTEAFGATASRKIPLQLLATPVVHPSPDTHDAS